MRRIKKPVVFIVIGLIALFSFLAYSGIHTQYGDTKKTYIKGVEDIRLGIDIRGGVDVTFTPEEGVNATNLQMDAVKSVIEQRMVKLNITDYEIYVDYNNDRVIARFPWQAGEEEFDPEAAVKELGETALLTFREGYEVDDLGLPKGESETIILQGADVVKAEPVFYEQNGKNIFSVSLKLSNEGSVKFAEATKRLALTKGVISIWMDDVCISTPSVSEEISGGEATISRDGFTYEEVKELSDKINSGALPFKLQTSNFSTISPSLGKGALDTMVLAGIIAFGVVCVFIIWLYKLPGVVASIALAGQVMGSIAAVSGFFGFVPSFTLTIPGIAGIILAIGVGVDANIITAERIREELNRGKTLNAAIEQGYKRAFTAIFDGNVTIILIAVILMGAFGPPDSIMAKALNWAFFMFGPSTAGTIYSFGYTLLVGVIFNFIFGVTSSRLMISSLSKFKAFRNPKLYGGDVIEKR